MFGKTANPEMLLSVSVTSTSTNVTETQLTARDWCFSQGHRPSRLSAVAKRFHYPRVSTRENAIRSPRNWPSGDASIPTWIPEAVRPVGHTQVCRRVGLPWRTQQDSSSASPARPTTHGASGTAHTASLNLNSRVPSTPPRSVRRG
jgi:hypothetical protein